MNSDDLSRTAQPGNVWDLFHRAWGQAKASPEYDKQVWTALDNKLLALQKCVEAAELRKQEKGAVSGWSIYVAAAE